MSNSKESLFRTQAVHNHTRFRLGGAKIIQAPGLGALSLFTMSIIGLILMFLVYGNYARKETVRGYLLPQSGLVKVYAEGHGTIEKVHVENNQLVARGQPLLSIVISTGHVDGIKPVDLLRKELEIQHDALLQSIGRAIKSYELEKGQLQEASLSTLFELQQSQEILELHQQQIDLSQQKHAALKQLYRQGHLPELEWLSYKEALIQQQQTFELSRQQQASLKLKLVNAEQALQQLPIRKENTLQELESHLSRIRQQQAELMHRRNYQILAPVDGRVTNLQARPGQQIREQFPQLTILPNGQDLIGHLLIPTRAIGFVKRGQKVNLLYDAFPYQHFGVFKGNLISVSGSILSSGEISGPVQIGEPAYIASVELIKQSIDAFGREVALQPGMLLRADIILEDRSLLQWMLEPLYSLRGRT
jgi:membrane fusion protein